MCLMVICDHDRIGHSLRDDLIPIVFDRENDLEAKLLILVATVAGNPHRKLNLHRARRW